MIQTINEKVDYNDGLKFGNGKFYNFGCYIFTKCDDLIEEALHKMRVYLETNKIDYLDSDLVDAIGKLLIEPTFNGYQTESVKALYLQSMGYKLYTFTSEENRLLFDSDYSIDFIVEMDGKYYGVQSKSGSYLNVGWKDRDFSLRRYHHNKHLKAMQDIHKYEGIEIEDIYFMFNDVGNVYNMLIYDSPYSWGTALKKGDCLVSTYDMVKLSQNDYPLVRFKNFKYVDIRGDLRAS